MRYTDPSGHTWGEFYEGLVAQWLYANLPMASSLAVKQDEPRDRLIGRVVGSAAATAQGMGECVAGQAAMGGGAELFVASPATGPGVLVVAPAGAAGRNPL